MSKKSQMAAIVLTRQALLFKLTTSKAIADYIVSTLSYLICKRAYRMYDIYLVFNTSIVCLTYGKCTFHTCHKLAFQAAYLPHFAVITLDTH